MGAAGERSYRHRPRLRARPARGADRAGRGRPARPPSRGNSRPPRGAQIAAGAGLPRAARARHFDDKEACYLATYDALVEWVGEGVRAALSRRGGWPQAVRTAVEAILDPIAADPRLARFCGLEAQRAGAPAFERHRAVVGELARSLRVGREHCAWGDELPDQLEETLVSGAIWSIARVAKSGGAESLRGLAPELTYFLLTPYLDVAEARRMAGLEQVRSR